MIFLFLFYIQGGHKDTIRLSAAPQFNQPKLNVRYISVYLKICARDCGEQEKWRLHGYGYG